MHHIHERPTGPEHRGPEPPRIYIASLSDYNAGRLHGIWLDATADLDDLHAGIADMLYRSIEESAEEIAIHDFEAFGPYQPHEYEPIDTVARIARGIAEHGWGYAHWANHVGSDPDQMDDFEDHYLGRWDSMAAFVDELAEDFGIEQLLDNIATPWRYYIHLDTAALARDLATDYTIGEGPDGTHLFTP